MQKTDLEGVPPGLLEERGEHRLHIGGEAPREGWKILNARPGQHVDYVGDLRDLSQFADQTFDLVYASHVVEHLPYQEDLPKALAGIRRVLKEGGRFMVSVPDLTTLCRLFLHPQGDSGSRFEIMRMMFGGQVHEFDFHYVGLTDEILAGYFQASGFSEVYRVKELGIFEDTSSMRYRGVLISLNMVAVR